MLDYPVILTPDDGSVLVTFPDVPEAITQGEDEDEALLYAIDALESDPFPIYAVPDRFAPRHGRWARLGRWLASARLCIGRARVCGRITPCTENTRALSAFGCRMAPVPI